jgi:hypothetical protein
MLSDPSVLAHSMTLTEWLSYGESQGWCTSIVCGTHDAMPSTPEEEDAWDEGGDPCQAIIRIW